MLDHIERCRAYVGRYTPSALAVVDLASSPAFLARFADRARDDMARLADIWLGDRLVGAVALRTMNVAEGVAAAGCWLEEAVVGRGLVTRAMTRLIDWAVDERGIHRIEWRARSDNAPSIAVARRLVMRREGVLRERVLSEGTRYDLEIWAVVGPDLRAHRAGVRRPGDPQVPQ